MTTNKDSLNRANPNVIADLMRLIAIGSLLRGQIPQVKRALNMDALGARPENVSTLDVFVPEDGAQGCTVLRATARAGGVTGELAPQVYGTTPATGQIAVAPNGSIVTLAADAITDLDVTYTPERGDVVELELPVNVATGACALPAQITSRKVIALLEAEVLTGTVTGRKLILIPASSAPATTQARLSLPKTVVHFNAATDAPTSARLKLLVAAEVDLDAVLSAAAEAY